MTPSNLNEFRVNNQLCDGIINTSDGASFPVHRVILSSFSSYFRAVFTNCLNNGYSEVTKMVIEDIPSDIVKMIIDFAYVQSCDVTQGNVHKLVVAADRLSCESLVTFCCEFISRNINTSNCIGILKFAKNYFFRNLELEAWQFACSRIEEVMLSSEFQYLTAEELGELLSADQLNVQQEETVFIAITKWIQDDPNSRKQHLSKLLNFVRLGLISNEFYSDCVKTYRYNTKESEELLKNVDELFGSNEFTFYYCQPRIPNEVVFTIGGWSQGNPTEVIETYDKNSQCWYLTTVKNGRRRAYHGVVTLNNLIYVIGGYNGSDYFNTMDCFDPATCTWSEKACMHEVRCYVSACTLNGEIYAIGGFNGRSRLKSAEKYDPSLNQWSLIASMNIIRSDASAAALDDKVYVAGGYNGHEVMCSVEVYDPNENQWSSVKCMNDFRSGLNLIAHKIYLYAIGGFDGRNRLSSVERFNPNINKWSSRQHMWSSRSNMASVVIDNCIYIIGGFDGTTTIPSTEFYDIEDNIWYEATNMNINRSALSACVCRDLPNAKSFTFLGNMT